VVSLDDDAIVMSERSAVSPIRLGDRHVEIPAAEQRRAFDQLEILRREHHRGRRADDVESAPRHVVELDPLGQNRRLGIGLAGLLAEDDVDGEGILGPLDLRRDPSKSQGIARGFPAKQVAVGARAERARGGKIVDRLEQITLSLRVIPPKYRRLRRDVEIETRIIAKVGEGEVEDAHGASAMGRIRPGL